MASRFISGVDVGGTFTDVVLFDADQGEISITKVPLTPSNQSDGVLEGIRAVLPEIGRLTRLVHGTTVSTNTMLERNGAKVALVTTDGFADVLEIGRTRRMLPSLYDTNFERPPPLVPRPMRFEAIERMGADGQVIKPLDERDVPALIAKIRESGAQSIAICFLHSHVNPVHESRVKALLREALPGVWITTSAEVVPEFREYERFSTTVINAYLLPVMDRYMSALSSRLGAAGYSGNVYTMSSSGGIMDLDAARHMPVRTILSGPAGGVAGALWIAEVAGISDFITCDMGGTSTDVSLIEDRIPSMVSETAFAGYPIKGREIAISTVGAGGGSIAFAEGTHTLRVGPRSAGAMPGPACYGRGGSEPTVTDANMVLGRLGTRTLGGAIQPDARRAFDAVARLADRLGVGTVQEMADGIVRIAVVEMANAIREISIERGYDPADFVLFPFGGAGPMHATQIAEEIGMPEILVPILPGNLCALGLLASDQRYERVQTFFSRLSDLDSDKLRRAFDEHEALESENLDRRGFARSAMQFQHAIDMRYARQGFELTVDIPVGTKTADDLRKVFLNSYARHFGRAEQAGEIELANIRTTAIGLTEKPAFPQVRRAVGNIEDAIIGKRDVIAQGKALTANVYERDRLPVDALFRGLAIVEESGSTTVILSGWSGRRDANGNLRISIDR